MTYALTCKLFVASRWAYPFHFSGSKGIVKLDRTVMPASTFVLL